MGNGSLESNEMKKLEYSDIANIIYNINGDNDGFKHARLMSLVTYLNKTLGFNIQIRKKDRTMRSDFEIARDIQDFALTNAEKRLMFTGKTDKEQRVIVTNLVKMVNRTYGSNILLKYIDFNGEHERSIEELSDDLYMIFDKVREKINKNTGLVSKRITNLFDKLKKRKKMFDKSMNDTFMAVTKSTDDIKEQRSNLNELNEFIENIQKKMITRTQNVLTELTESHENQMDKVLNAFPSFSSFSNLNGISQNDVRRNRKLELVVKAILNLSTNNIRCNACYEKLDINLGSFYSMEKINKLSYIKTKYNQLIQDIQDKSLRAQLRECYEKILKDIENDLKSCGPSTTPSVINTMNDLVVENIGKINIEDKERLRKKMINLVINNFSTNRNRLLGNYTNTNIISNPLNIWNT